ncbi:MAG: phosphate ABC transporter substrate-binding protein PstS [Microbacteriaceae bacterium]|nr:phosphate ABC transporter substrate-binding protein PstS [Microbacteriaceae bacterium]
MKFSPIIKATAAFGIAALALTGCAANEKPAENKGGGDNKPAAASNLSGELKGAGASSQKAAQEVWVKQFQTAHTKVTVNYAPDGSGAGREKFQQNGVAFAGSDRAFKKEELDKGGFGACVEGTPLVEFPAYISPIAVVFNVQGVKSLNLDAKTIAGIFSGKIKKWNDPAIVSQNKDAKLPDADITPVHRSDKSGTTENFTDYLNAVAPDAWTHKKSEEWPQELGGAAAKGTSGVIDTVKKGVGTIGYADASLAGDLGTAKIKVGEKYVAYSPEAAAAAIDASKIEEGRKETDLAYKLDRKLKDEKTYPLVLVSYLIGCSDYKEDVKAALVKEYFKQIISPEGQKEASKVAGNAPLSSTLTDKIKKIVEGIK